MRLFLESYFNIFHKLCENYANVWCNKEIFGTSYKSVIKNIWEKEVMLRYFERNDERVILICRNYIIYSKKILLNIREVLWVKWNLLVIKAIGQKISKEDNFKTKIDYAKLKKTI